MTLKETIFIRKQTNYWYEIVTELIKDPIIALVGFDYSTPPLDDDELLALLSPPNQLLLL